MISLKPALKAARLQLVADALSGGKLRLYAAPQPPAGDAPIGTWLAEIALPSPAATVEGATLTFAEVVDVQAVGDGDVAWGRFVDSLGKFVMDGTAGVVDAGADIQLADVRLLIGGFVRVISGTLTE